ncbi:MAG TPA: ABC transporter permease [Chryseolinea sp.]
MLKNYLNIAWRTIVKTKVFSMINIFGLAVGMAAFMFIIQYVQFERSYEAFNKNADNIYRITLDLYNGKEFVVTDCETYAPVGPLLKEKMPEVVDYVRMYHNDGLKDIEANNRKFLEEGIYFADPSAFNFFAIDLLHGDPLTALSAPYKAVLSETMAKKYFGRTDALGESFKMGASVYQVSAIMKDVPYTTHLKFNTLVSHATLGQMYSWYKEDSWNGNNEYTYLQLEPGTSLSSFNSKLVTFAKSLHDKIGDERFVAEPIKDIHLYSNKSFEPEVNGSAKTVYSLLVIAIFIIVIAWVNYINLSTARAIERAKEVGIRKVMGSLRSQLIFQFLAESAIVNIIAAALAFVLFQTGLPFFRTITGQPLSLDIVGSATFWYVYLAILGVGTLLSGFYPAIVLSSFKPVTVLKGKFRTSSHGQRLRQGLVVFQFGATVILMIGMSAVYLQLKHLRTIDLGMSLDQTLVVRAPYLEGGDSIAKVKQQALETALLLNPSVQTVAGSEIVPGLSQHEMSTTSSVTKVGEEKKSSYTYYFFSIDAGFLPALELKLLAGRNFEAGMPNHDMVIINEEAVYRLGFSSPEEALGSKISFITRRKGQPSTIIGVVAKYYQQSPKEQQIPLLLRYEDNADYFSIRLNTDNMSKTLAEVKEIWNQVFPNTVFHYFFLDEKYDQQYSADMQFGKVVATFSGLAVFIACLGLFGLSAFTIVQRTKEIGIRKVLGASVLQIVHLLSKDFGKVVLLASLLALPIAYIATKQWLSGYAVKITLNVWMFLFPVIIIFTIAILTVSFQTIKTALENPSGSLRQE